MERLLFNGFAAFEHPALALELRLDPPLEKAEAVHVLQLGLGAERVAAGRAQRDVAVDAQASFLHVHVRDPEAAERGAQELGELAGPRR